MAAVTSHIAAAPSPSPVSPRDRVGFDGAVRTTGLLLLWAGLLLVTYWWAADGGLQDLAAWESGLLSAGRLSGLVASYLLLAQVILMSRVPVLEHAFGLDRIARLHRIVGFTSFTLMLAHVVLISWGYAGGRLGGVASSFWNLTVTYPGMLLAAAGTVCLSMVVLTSARAARRRLRYEGWHLLHLYAYLGVGLALPHQLWTGQQFLASSAETAFWWTAWAAAAAAVVLWRVALPVVRNLRHDIKVVRLVREAPDVVSVHLTGRRLDRLPVEAGQFMTWRFLGAPGWTRGHPYSLSATPRPHGLRVTARVVGDGSAALARVRPGSRALFEGPYGRLSGRARTRDKVLLMGSGVGITPLRALAEGLDYSPGDATLLYRYADQPLFTAEIDWLVRERGLRAIWLRGPRRTRRSWLPAGVGADDDAATLRRWVPDLVHHDVFLCGPDGWTDSVRRTLTTLGLPADQLHVESFRW
jgi:predicted ferric reductase